jgi:hypothetical protein
MYKKRDKIIIFTIISIFTLFLLSGCQDDLPPEPGDINLPIGQATGYYQGYGPPNDVFNDNIQIFFLDNNVFNLPPEKQNIDLNVQVEHEGGFVYRYGHYYTELEGWKRFEFPQDTVSGSNWIKESANTYVKVDKKEIYPGENYIVAYSCKKYDGSWKCGCSQKGGACNQWMLNTYLYRNVDLPPEPIAPDSIITTRAWISPNGRLVKSNDDVNLYVSLSSTKDILHDIEDIEVRITDPVNDSINMGLSRNYNQCLECKGDSCSRQFQCHSSYWGKFVPELDGEHVIDFGDLGEVPEWLEVNTGKFKAGNSIFEASLIENDIGLFKFKNSYGYYSDLGYDLSASYFDGSTEIWLGLAADYYWLKQDFNNIKSNSEYSKENIDGNTVYLKQTTVKSPYYKEVTRFIEVVWMSDNKLIRTTMYGVKANLDKFNDFKALISAYLKLHPTSTEGEDDPTDVGSESWQIKSKRNNKFEISENLVDRTNFETIDDVSRSLEIINHNQLPNLLSSGIVSNNKGDFSYNQGFNFLNKGSKTGYIQLTQNDADTTAVFLYFKSGEPIAEYRLIFENSFESNTVNDGLFNGNVLTMLGKKYEIVDTVVDGNFLTITMINNPTKDTLLEGKSKTYIIDSTEYEVSLEFVDVDSAKFMVNGELTRDLRIGETGKLSDGIIVGVSEITYQDFAGGVKMAEFFLGTDKIELGDSDISSIKGGHLLKVNDQTIDGATLNIDGTWHKTDNFDDNIYSIDIITVKMLADDDYYVLPSTTLSQTPDLDEPELLFTQSWDIEYKGLTNEPMNTISISPSGINKYTLKFKDGDGSQVNLPLAERVDSSLVLGEKDKKLVLTETKVIEKDDYFIVTRNSGSYALQYKGADKISSDNALLKFKNLGDGRTIEQTYTNSDRNKVATIKIGNGSFDIYNRSSTAINDFNIVIDQNGDGIINNDVKTKVVTQYGANIEIGDLKDSSFFDIAISTHNKLSYENVEPTPFEYRIGLSETESSRIQLISQGNHNYETPDGETNAMYAYSSYGALAKFTNPQDEQETVSIEYPKNQRIAQVFITGEYEIPPSS